MRRIGHRLEAPGTHRETGTATYRLSPGASRLSPEAYRLPANPLLPQVS